MLQNNKVKFTHTSKKEEDNEEKTVSHRSALHNLKALVKKFN